ncbi:MAG: hypothetical protein LBF97_02035 [Elusimicrobiota bacterium]|jgi:predicted  nucleic acid-binding Zn-ribbon protein|nr:hypothetical protein [Elusimicrobiota bacterium]
MLNNLEAILKLQDTDKKIQDVKNKIQNIPSILKSTQDILNNEIIVLENIKKNLADNQSKRQDLETELSRIEKNIENYNLELNTVKSNDKYKTIIEIIKTEKLKQSEIEDKVLAYFETLDKINSDLKNQKEKIKKLEVELSNKEKEINTEKKILEQENIELEKSRQELTKIIDDKNFMGIYDKIRTHHNGIGIVCVDMESHSCTSCNMHLPLQKINEILQTNGPVLCENCSKILYIKQ